MKKTIKKLISTEQLSVSFLLEQYKQWIVADEIDFLREKTKEKRNIKKHIEDLIEEQDKLDKGKTTSADWHEMHRIGTKLWKDLASCSLNHIDNVSKGNSQLFKFLKASTEFEDILYGLEPYYRDHTLHSLWVYLIGMYIFKNHLPEIYKAPNWYLYNDIEDGKKVFKYPPALVKEAGAQEKKFCEKVNNKKDAIWCIMALCHDLGYSLAKLDQLNGKVKAVLDFFDFSGIKQVGYSIDVEHQYLAAQFLELMSMDVRIVPSENYREKNICPKEKVLIKCYRDDSTYWRVCRALEKKQHGVLSAYLIYKILGIFADSWIRGAAEEWGLEDDEVIDNIIRGDILFAIAQHEFDFAHLIRINSFADVLILADELEEFSRYGRQLQARRYEPTTAHSEISFKKIKGDSLEIIISYEVMGQNNLKDFFTRKASGLCKLYSLDQVEGKKKALKRYKIMRIKMSAKKNKDILSLNFSGMDRHKIKVKGPTYEEIARDMLCYDDKLVDIDSRESLDTIIKEKKEITAE